MKLSVILCAVLLLLTDAGGSVAVVEPEIVSETRSDVFRCVETLPTKHLYGTCTITHYCGCAACCGAWGNHTASGAVPTARWTVASNCLPFGTKLEINGHTYCVEDRGDDKMNNMWIDIYCSDHAEALQRGMYQTEVWIIDEG